MIRIKFFFIFEKKMNFIVEKILIFIVLLKYVHVQNNDSEQSCLNWTDWNNFKTDFHIDFYDLSLEKIA